MPRSPLNPADLRLHRPNARWCSALLLAAAGLPASAQESLLPSSATGTDSGPENQFYELGTVFRVTAPGRISHLRVYGLASESGLHTARLWRNADNALVGGPWAWTYGGSNAWLLLDIPDIAVGTNADYTVTISTGEGGRNYPFRSRAFDLPGGNGLHLQHPVGAGVYSTTPGARPTAVFQHSSYFRDVVFQPDPPEPPMDAPVRLNEFLAENESGLGDEDGDSADWIELYNPRGAPVELGGHQLTDGVAVWTFPPVTIGAQGFLVVFATGKNRPGPVLHTNFKLDQAGEYLALLDPEGTVLTAFAPVYPGQRADVSYGRGAGGATGFMTTPSPGSPNAPTYAGFVRDTVFSAKRGFYSAPLQVAITSATPDAVVHYTLDGSVPTEESPVYSGPLQVVRTTTLRARAFKPGHLPPHPDTSTYVFPEDLLQQSAATALDYGWPAGPVNGQVLRYGANPATRALYSAEQMAGALAQVPLFSIVTDQAALTGAGNGIYVNATRTGLEQPASIELLQPGDTNHFQVDAGLRIRGGQSRNGTFPKHSFNMFFRDRYGPGRLEYPLFGPDGPRRFDTLSLRCEHGYAYADPYGLNYRLEFTAMRDAFCRELWAAAGHASTRSRYYHLLLNGQYWGLYQTQERAQEDFGSTHFGGQPEEYDGVAATGLPELTIEATSGTLTAWSQLWTGARAVQANPSLSNYLALLGRAPDGSPSLIHPVLLDPAELADYMLLHYYTGHSDEPLSVSFNFERPNNFRALRRRGRTEPWHFLVHDGESSLRASDWVDNRANAVNLTSPNRNQIAYSNPEWIHEDLLASPEYRLAFADAAQRLLFHDGPFTAERATPLWDGLAAAIRQAVIGESIRWGQSTNENQATWSAKVDEVRRLFFPTRSARVVTQLRQRNLFPSVDAPGFSQRGGRVTAGFALTCSTTAAGATIYYTTDGSDPRALGGAPAGLVYSSPILLQGPAWIRARVRSATGEWSALDEALFTTHPPAARGSLVLSKVHYHPPPPNPDERAAGHDADNDFEYVELQNVTVDTLDLRGVTLSGGITFAFTDPRPTTLGPGDRLVIAENAAAFAHRYGPGRPLAGTYQGNLSDGGEALTLAEATGTPIATITYDDVSPWPILADGAGHALVLRAPDLDPALASSWRASFAPGGKPGDADVFTLADWRALHFTAAELADPAAELIVWSAGADPDADAHPNLVEYALGTDPRSPADRPRFSASLVRSGEVWFLQATWQVRAGIEAVSLIPEVSDTLDPNGAWQPLTATPLPGANDLHVMMTVLDPRPVGNAGQRFLRLRIAAE